MTLHAPNLSHTDLNVKGQTRAAASEDGSVVWLTKSQQCNLKRLLNTFWEPYLGIICIILASSCYSGQVTRPMGHRGKASCVHNWEWCIRVSAAMTQTPWQSYQPGHLFLVSHPAWAKSLRRNESNYDRLNPAWFILVSSMCMHACVRLKSETRTGLPTMSSLCSAHIPTSTTLASCNWS